MRCSVHGYPGEYEERRIVHTVRRDGEIIVIDGVPAHVCSVCGDVLLKPQTIRRIERIRRSRATPPATVPLSQCA